MKLRGVRMAILGGATMICIGATGFAQQDGGGTAGQDKMFLAKSAEGGMAEIQMSKLALKKSKNDEVKSFAQKMIDDHTKLMSDMKPLCSQMGVTPPMKLNKEHQMEASRLASLSGDKFDHEYVTAMVADHHKDLSEFKAEQSSTTNADLKNTVSQGIPVIQEHTEMIDRIAQEKGIPTPAMPSL